MTKNLFHFKRADSGMRFIGWDETAEVYSTDYYANIGLMNAEASKHVPYREIKRLTQWCINQGYKQVTYLPR